MTETVYRVLPHNDQWRLEHDGRSVAYATKTAAFEAAVIAAERAIRSADEVRIYVDPLPNTLNGHASVSLVADQYRPRMQGIKRNECADEIVD